MMENKSILLPSPIIDAKEDEKIVKEAAESRIDVKEVSLCTKA